MVLVFDCPILVRGVGDALDRGEHVLLTEEEGGDVDVLVLEMR